MDNRGEVSRTSHLAGRVTYFVRHAVRDVCMDLAMVLDLTRSRIIERSRVVRAEGRMSWFAGFQISDSLAIAWCRSTEMEVTSTSFSGSQTRVPDENGDAGREQ